MSKEISKQKRIVFNWHDGIAIGLSFVILIIILLVSLFGLPTSSVEDAYIEVRYGNTVVTDNLKVADSKGDGVTYVLSFRRKLKEGEKYDSNEKVLEKYSLKERRTSLSSLRKINFDKDINYVINAYHIIEDLDNSLGGFSYFVGPQVDVLVNNKGFQIENEDSPHHYCSIQGFEDKVNWPVVCLPNNFSVTLISTSPFGEDDGQV